MEKVFYKKTLVGIRITVFHNGTNPATDASEPLQLLTLKHPKGTYLKAHYHASRRRVTGKLQECLMVRKGRVKIDLYGPDHKKFRSLFLKEGQIFLLLNGGYGIHVQENAELIELKNGPFKEDKILI